jgi:predicted DNA-binding transcriptional regulator AlpA
MAQDMVRRAMRLEAVLEALGLSRSAFYAGIKEGFYPAPTKIGDPSGNILPSKLLK